MDFVKHQNKPHYTFIMDCDNFLAITNRKGTIVPGGEYMDYENGNRTSDRKPLNKLSVNNPDDIEPIKKYLDHKADEVRRDIITKA